MNLMMEDSNTDDNQVVQREIENYKAEPLLDNYSDPLDWWRLKLSKSRLFYEVGM